MTLDKKIYLTNLYDIYYFLFTKRQQEIIEMFFEEDYSVTEIADMLDVSLAAISKTVGQIESKLVDLEKHLRVYENYSFNIKLLEQNNISKAIIKSLK